MILNEFFNLPQVFEKDMAEGSGNIGDQIRAAYKKIYDQGDDAIEFAYYDSPIFAQYWDEYEGDLDSIIAEVDPSELQIILDELTSAAEDQGVAEADAAPGSKGYRVTWTEAGQKSTTGLLMKSSALEIAKKLQTKPGASDVKVVPYRDVSEGHADQQRKIVKKNGKPVGEVGIDRESSPGVGQWYMKCYTHNVDNSGYDSMEEALEELKHCLTQGVAEGIFGSKPSPVLPMVDKIAKVAGGLTPQNVEVGKQIIQANARDITRILSPQAKAGIDVIEGTRERLSNLHDKIRKEKGLPDPKEYLKIAQQKKKEIADLKAQDKKEVGEGKGDYVPPKEADYGPEYQAMVKRVGQKARAQEKGKQQPKQPVRESRRALLKQIIQS